MARKGVTETDVTCIYMSALLFTARKYSEDADENVVLDACVNPTREGLIRILAACRTLLFQILRKWL